MQTRIHNKIVFECDSCAESLDTGWGNFGAACSALRKAKWKSRKVGEMWFHYCDGCDPNRRKEVEAEGQRNFKGFL